MEFFSFIGGMLLSLFSFIFHLIIFSAPIMLLVGFLFRKDTIIHRRIVSFTNFLFGVVIGPALAVYFTAINPQMLDVFYDKLWRYNATQVTIDFNREPTNSEVQASLQSIIKSFPDLQTIYPTIRVFSRHGGSNGRLVGSDKVIPHYWKKEGHQVFLYLSEALSEDGLKAVNGHINQRFFSRSEKLSKNIKLELIETPSTRSFRYIQKMTPFTVSNAVQLESIDKRLLVYPKTYFTFPDLNKKLDKPTAECSIKFKIEDDYWPTFLQITTDSILNNKNEIAKSVLKLKDAEENEIKLVLRRLFLDLKFNAEFSNGEKYPASIFISEKEESHLVITIKKYYDEIGIFRESYENKCFNLIKEIPIFNNTFVDSHFLMDFPGKPSLRSLSVQTTKFSPFYDKVSELIVKPMDSDEIN